MPPRARLRRREPALPNPPSNLDQEGVEALLAERIVAGQLGELGEMSYHAFCRDLLGWELTEGQEAITRVLFDGEAPAEKYADSIFGGLRTAPDKFALRVVAAVVGRGAGKSRALLAARALHLALKVDLSRISPNEPPSLVALLAPDTRHSKQTLSFIRGFLEDRPILKKVLQAECLVECIRVTRLDGRRVNIEVRPASAGGDSVRGPVLAGVLFEESAFFEGEGYAVSDTEIFRAARPRLLPDGQIVFASSPWAQAGKLWELYRDNFGKPDSAVVCKAPTLLVRPSEDTRRAYEAELKNDPDNARREYDAEFLSADSERFFPEAILQQCIDEALHLPLTVVNGERVRFGGDFAFASDSSALFGFVERASPIGEEVNPPARLWACDIDEQRPAVGVPLVPSQVVARFAERMQKAGCRLLVADAHYRQSIEEHLSTYGVALTSVSHTPAHDYVLARSLMAQGRVRIPPHNRLLSQLRRVRATQKPGGVISIHQPRSKEGGHGDLVSAMIAALSGITVDSAFKAAAPTGDAALAKDAKLQQEARLKENEKRQKKAAVPMSKLVRRILGEKTWRSLR